MRYKKVENNGSTDIVKKIVKGKVLFLIRRTTSKVELDESPPLPGVALEDEVSLEDEEVAMQTAIDEGIPWLSIDFNEIAEIDFYEDDPE